jgi:uncharacterized protein (TIGR02594 family)
MGMAGPDVKALQLALAKLGYPLSGTGYFGSATDTAVSAFQRRVGLEADGDVGTSTAAAIDKALGAPKPATGVLAPARSAADIEVSRELWLQEAISHIGMREVAGAGNNMELVHDIQTVAPEYDRDETPWCAGFVSFCLVKAGLKASKKPLWALSYADGYGVKLAGPALGAIAVKSRTGGGHATFVAGRTAGGLLACCGGNQNDAVNISGYAQGMFNKGFFWPKDVPLPALIGMSHLPVVSSNGKVSTKES